MRDTGVLYVRVVCASKCASMGGGFPLCRLIFITHCKEIRARAGGYNTRRQKRTRRESVARQKEMGKEKGSWRRGLILGLFCLIRCTVLWVLFGELMLHLHGHRQVI